MCNGMGKPTAHMILFVIRWLKPCRSCRNRSQCVMAESSPPTAQEDSTKPFAIASCLVRYTVLSGPTYILYVVPVLRA